MSFEYWRTLLQLELQKEGASMSYLRPEPLANALNINEIRCLRLLSLTESFDDWIGAELLSRKEMEFLDNLRSDAKFNFPSRFLD